LAANGKRFTRRRLVVGSAVAAALAGVAFLISPLWKGPSEVTPTLLVAHAQELLDDQDFTRADAWSHRVEASPQRFPANWLRVPPDAWRRISTDVDRRAVVYRIPLRGKFAYLFAMKTSAQPVGLGAKPPRKPFAGATGGWKIGAWTSEQVVYVLAIEGSEQDYLSLIRSRTVI
jgi:hypothetical protein